MNIYGLGGLYGWNGGLGYGNLGYGNFGYSNLGYGSLNYSVLSAAYLNYLGSLYGQSKIPDSVNLSNVRNSVQTKQNAAQTRRTGAQHNTPTKAAAKINTQHNLTAKKTSAQQNLTTRTAGKTSAQRNLASTAEAAYYPSFQTVLAASMKEQDFTKLLTEQYLYWRQISGDGSGKN